MHVAMIMDGNRRWAQRERKSVASGYLAGMRACVRAIDWASSNGVKTLSLFAFSTDNWSRPRPELEALFALAATFSTTYGASFGRRGIRIKVLGDLRRLPKTSRLALQMTEWITRRGDRLDVNIMVNYSGRSDLVNGVRALARQVASGALRPEEIDEAALAHHLVTRDAEDPDVVIRTGRERRLSNFMLYQCARSELVFLDIFWPEITADELDRVLGPRLYASSRPAAAGAS